MKNIIFFWFLGLLCCQAQDTIVQKKNIKSYDEKVVASVYFYSTSNNFQFVSNTKSATRYLDLIPNRREQIGFSLSYKLIDISYGFSPRFFDVNRDNSNSRLENIGTRFVIKQWMQTLLYTNQKGFYALENDSSSPFPNMQSVKIGGTTSYIFNPNFSFKTITNQNQWQTKSIGSFIPTLSIYHTDVDLNDEIETAKSKIWLATLAPSYYYNWVISNRILISSGVGVGLGFHTIDGKFSSVVESSLNLKLGYNSDSFFTFVHLNYANFIQNEKNPLRLNENIANFRVTSGYRFDPPKKIKTLYDKGTKALKIH